MSDNFHDDFEEGIRDNAGHLALAGALFAHSQRKQQLQSLEASRQHQAQIAKTEAQRLEIEKQRLELEKLKQQAEKDEKEAVRLLRVMMADVGAELHALGSTGDLSGSPSGIRRDYAMAVLLSKLALVRSRSSVLNDLNDLKELVHLEGIIKTLVSKHFLGRDPVQITRDKRRDLEAWIETGKLLEKEAQKGYAMVPAQSNARVPSLKEIQERESKLTFFQTQLHTFLVQHTAALPADSVADGVLFPELSEQALLDELQKGSKAGLNQSFSKHARQVGVIPNCQPQLEKEVQAGIAALQQWQKRHFAHSVHLQRITSLIEEGKLSEARMAAQKIGEHRFDDLRYKPLTDLESLEKTLAQIGKSKRGKAAEIVRQVRAKYPNAEATSILGVQLNLHHKRAAAEKTKALVLAVVLIGLVAGFAKVMVDNHREGLRLAAEAKAEGERLAAEAKEQALKLAAEAKAKAEAEQKERERMAAEAKKKAEAEQKERERMAAEAKAKAEAERIEITKKFQATTAGAQVNVLLNDALSQSFVLVPSGSFTMGSSSNEEGHSSDENQVEVTLSQSFLLAKTEVTQAQWEAVMGSNPSEFKGPNLPVENVSWEDVQAFIAKLNEKQILPQGWKFALPTEAQWEYACRAGEKGPYSGGSLDEVGWYAGNSGGKTHEAAKKKPNAWGLYDMHGNVWEWCADGYKDTLKGGIDPVGPSSGFYRVFRGGSWIYDASYCRAANRDGFDPGYRIYSLGFRPALVPSR